MLSKLACASRSLRRPSAVRALGLYQTSISSNLSSKLLFEKVAVSNKRYFSTSSLLSEQGQRVEQDAEGVTEIGGLHPISKTALRRMGIDKLFEVQAVTFQKTKIGNDLIVQAPTGSGKTLSFVLPVMEKLIAQAEKGRYRLDRARGQARPACLVIAPTRELATQIAEVFDDYIAFTRDQLPDSMRNIETCCVYGGAPMANQYRTLTQGNADIVIGTPGRIYDWLKDDAINLRDLEILIMDEVDEMLSQQWHEELADILKFAKYWQTKSKLENKQALLYSATVPGWVKEIEKEVLSTDCEVVSLVSEEDLEQNVIAGTNKNVYHYNMELGYISNVQNAAKVLNFTIQQLTELKNQSFEKAKIQGKIHESVEAPTTRTIVFCNKISECEELQNLIKDSEIFHGKMEQSDRKRVYDAFRYGQVPTLVASDLASRGLDIPNVDFVIHFDFPTTWVNSYIETYINRAGRSGRAGKSGISILMHGREGYSQLEKLNKLSGIEFEQFLLPAGLDATAR